MGAYNTPANVKYSVAAIAYVNEMKQQEVAEQVLESARRFFVINLIFIFDTQDFYERHFVNKTENVKEETRTYS